MTFGSGQIRVGMDVYDTDDDHIGHVKELLSGSFVVRTLDNGQRTIADDAVQAIVGDRLVLKPFPLSTRTTDRGNVIGGEADDDRPNAAEAAIRSDHGRQRQEGHQTTMTTNQRHTGAGSDNPGRGAPMRERAVGQGQHDDLQRDAFGAVLINPPAGVAADVRNPDGTVRTPGDAARPENLGAGRTGAHGHAPQPAIMSATAPVEMTASQRKPSRFGEAYTLSFPADHRVGTVYMSEDPEHSTLGYAWTEVGPALGEVTVPGGRHARLDVEPDAVRDLRWLGALGDTLHTLNFTMTPATDADLQVLRAFPSLRHLDLSHTRVTDAGLAEVATLKGLEALNVSNTAVTDAGLAHVRALPELTLVHANQEG